MLSVALDVRTGASDVEGVQVGSIVEDSLRQINAKYLHLACFRSHTPVTLELLRLLTGSIRRILLRIYLIFLFG